MTSAKKPIIKTQDQKTSNKSQCTSCGKYTNDFYQSKSKNYEYIGILTVCKNCLDVQYEEYLRRFNFDTDKAIYYLCMKFDMPFYQGILNGAKGQIEKSGGKLNKIYIQKLNSLREANDYGNDFLDGEKLFSEISSNNKDINEKENDNQEIEEEYLIFWGYGFDYIDYIFLEKELANWKGTHKCDNQAELTLLKEICIKILEIRKKRQCGDNASKEIKDLQELMKTASVDPAKANVADGGKSLDAYGLWIKDIEEYEPAEYFKDKKMFEDFDKIKPYTLKYIFRPLKNLLTGSRDFDIEGDKNNIDDDEGDE